jgi:hypothetical protein
MTSRCMRNNYGFNSGHEQFDVVCGRYTQLFLRILDPHSNTPHMTRSLDKLPDSQITNKHSYLEATRSNGILMKSKITLALVCRWPTAPPDESCYTSKILSLRHRHFHQAPNSTEQLFDFKSIVSENDPQPRLSSHNRAPQPQPTPSSQQAPPRSLPHPPAIPFSDFQRPSSSVLAVLALS